MEPIRLASSPARRVTDWATARVVVVGVPTVPESPAQHVRNALMLLHVIEELSPAVWSFTPELGRAARRSEAALVFLEHQGPAQFAAVHIRGAIATLLEAAVDPAIIPECTGAVRRLFQALFLIGADS